MSLKYALLENLLTARTYDYTAQPQDVESHDIDSITERMLQKGSTITKTDTLAVLNSFFETIQEVTKEGEGVNTDLINTNFSIQGVFEGATDSFDPKRHTVRLNINAGKVLRKELSDITLEKTAANEVLPHILEVKDSITASVNENITSAGVIEIVGSLLKIEGSNPINGISFISQDGTARRAVTIVDNKPAKLILIAPALKAGDYTLQVTTQYNGGGSGLKSPRTGTFNKPLTVI